jgi:hypothetical protein
MEASEEALQAAEGPPSGSLAHADHPVSNNRPPWDPLARPAHVRKPRNVKPEVVMRSVSPELSVLQQERLWERVFLALHVGFAVGGAHVGIVVPAGRA